ncbi:MAG: polysaccharide deacetylase family protein [Planctomycetota bacterium]|jgi:peptidoglycan/xylan/chitin deacetylase (PgdA/CDA1 family)
MIIASTDWNIIAVDEKKRMRDTSPEEIKIQKMRPLGVRLTRIPVNNKERQAAKYRGVCYIEGPGFERKLALTFDDGPSNLTEPLLDLLKSLGVKATFFWLGRNMKEFVNLVRRTQADGHTFGNHSFDHPDFTKISTEEVLCEQIRKTQMVYREMLDIEPALVRPPFNNITDEQIEALKDAGMKTVFSSIDARDWITHNNNSYKISSRVLNIMHEEAIVLMHDGGSAQSDTIKAVRSIVDTCRMRGYEFVTVHDLIGAEKSL